MFDPSKQAELKVAVAQCIHSDQGMLDSLRAEIRPLLDCVVQVTSRNVTSVSLVGADGGNNQLHFDPFLIHLVRVVDSSAIEYCLDVVSPTTSIDALDRRQFGADGTAQTALGAMMLYLGVTSLSDLSHMIRPARDGTPKSASWVQVYRELVEWATLFELLGKDYGTDTLVVFDGLLRSKVFSKDLFARLHKGMAERIESLRKRNNRQIFLVGMAKKSKVLDRYRLAMSLEGVLKTSYPSYVEVPREIEERAYIWSEYARGDDNLVEGREINKFVAGKMFLVKFGANPRDPIWPVDIFLPQSRKHHEILGSMLHDAEQGFPVPYFPLCLQKAHEHAVLTGFDIDIMQGYIYDKLRAILGKEKATLDEFMLQDVNPARHRYS